MNAEPVKNEAPVEPCCYSHVLHFPNKKPFNIADLRWPGFIGAFVAPIVSNHPEVLYWFSFYGAFARFRVHTADYEAVRPELEALRDKLGLEDKGEEKDYVLDNDLGGIRFRGPNCQVSAKARAVSVLRALKGASDLMVESVVQRADGYWEFEANGDEVQNPISGHRFSVCHLFHNLMDSKARVFAFHDARGFDGVLSHIYFHNALQSRQIAPVSAQHHDILI